jgi:trimeric autotransporter adhesin
MIKILLLCCICWGSVVSFAQNAGIGTLAPDSSAQLDIQSTTRGLLIPSMTQSQISGITSPAAGLLVFQTDHTSGFYYNAGTPVAPSWQPLAPPSNQTIWKLTGNSGTDPANDFVGTADNKPLSFRVNNIISGFIDSIKARTFLGYGAGNTASTGYGNVAIGKSSLSSASTGNANVALGDSALNSYTEGDGSVAVGFYSLAQNVYGVYNTAVGYYSLYATPVSGNTATGAATLSANTQGGNTAKGYGALESNIAGSNNTALGTNASGNNPSTDYQNYQNAAAGAAALAYNFSGRANTAIGYNTLVTNSSGGANTATGYEALGANLTGGGNTSLGAFTIGITRDGASLTAIGANSQGTASTGPEGENTTDGAYALYHNASGVYCTAIGGYALYNNSGKSNTATGYGAMYGTGDNGSDNTAFGANTLTQMVANSDGNTAVGTNALLHSNAGAYNTAAGYAAFYLLADSRYNTAIGYGAGIGYALTYTLSHSNTILGANCDVGSDNLNNCIAIGQQVTCTADNQVRIGNLATNSIGGQVGWTTFSDGRFKKNIREDVKGLDFILRLKPVTYQLDMDIIRNKLQAKGPAKLTPVMQTAITTSGQVVHSGFVAQDVEKAATESGFDFSGVDKPSTPDGLYGLRYEDFVVPLVKAVQEQQQQIETLQKGNVDINKRIQRIEEKLNH